MANTRQVHQWFEAQQVAEGSSSAVSQESLLDPLIAMGMATSKRQALIPNARTSPFLDCSGGGRGFVFQPH